MTVAHPPISSGVAAVDQQWGGLATGCAYLLTGRAGAGRSALALQTAQSALDEGLSCLLLSPREPAALVAIGHEAGVDLPAAHGTGRLRLLRMPAAADLAARGPAGLDKSYRDLIGLVRADRPGRVVVEDFTPLVQFETFERFQEAFGGLVDAIAEAETTLVIGLGDPANDASHRLLDVVEGLVDGTIRLDGAGAIHLSRPATEPAPEPASAPEPAAEPLPEPQDEPVEPQDAFASGPAASSDGASVETAPPTPTAAPAPAPDAHPAAEDAPEEPAEPPPLAPLAASAPEAPTVPDPFGLEPEADPDAPLSIPFATAAEPAATDEPRSPLRALPSPDLPPPTEIVPPPAADPALLLPADDPFGVDPVEALMDQGFLADSEAHVPSGAGEPTPFPLPSPAPVAAPPAPAFPAFAPLPAEPAPDAAAVFRSALTSAFVALPSGTGFLVVAVRMEPSAPEAVHFGTVEGGLRSALRAQDRILVDAARKRAVVLLPASGPDAGQGLFAGLQAHLRSALGPDAEPVLRTVAAVTIPDGQPFTSAADLLAYAFEN